MKRSYIIAAILAAITAAWILSGLLGDTAATPEATKPPAELEAQTKVPDVRVVVSTARQLADELVINGQTRADHKATLKAETRGRVIEVLADHGDRLEEGQPIVKLDPNDRAARLAQAKALLAQRQIEFEAASKLHGKGFKAKTQLAAAAAELEAARAAVATMEEDIDNTVVRAPFTGVLDRRNVFLGDFVDVGEPIAVMVDVDPILVAAYVSERQVTKVAPGSDGVARLVNGLELTGTVGYVASVADEETRTFRVELDVPNPMGRIVEGVTAELRLPLPVAKAHLIAPSILSLSDEGVVGVKIVNADQIVEFLPVRVIDSGAEGVWVDGLPETATLIVVGHEFVTTGQKVRPVSQAAAGAEAEGSS